MRKLLFCLALLPSLCRGQSWDEMTQSKIVNFDKLLVGTDKIIFVQPPPGVYWVILQGSTFIERTIADGTTFNVWLENAPYAPYRDGDKVACYTGCVPLMREFTDTKQFFPIHGTMSGPIVVAWPNRLGIAITPIHGGLDAPLQTWTSFAIVERPLPQAP